MNNQNEIWKELTSWGSPLASMPRTMPYAVPEGYFDNLSIQVVAGITGEQELAPAFTKAMPYTVPQGYFHTLPADILNKIKAEEAAAALPKATTQPFAVPEGYFDQLPGNILAAAKEAYKPRPKTITLGKTIWRKVQWAAAAVLLIGIGIGSYTFLQKENNGLNPEQQLAQLPNSIISEYIQQNIDEFDIDAIATNYPATGSSAMPANGQLSEDEIVNYLNETGWEENTIN